MRRLLLACVLLALMALTTSLSAQDMIPISYGEAVTGEITASDDVRYTFEGAAGDVVTITMIATDGNLDPRLFLTTADDIDAFAALAENDDSGDPEIGEYNARIADFELPDDGTYMILASRFSGTGTFMLALETPDAPADMGDDSAMDAMEEIRQWAVFATGTSEYGTDSYSFMQATGEPNTFDCGDIPTAWASESATGDDILALEYEQAVLPTQVNIHQTFTPGSIIRVELVNTDPETDITIELPDSADPPGNTPCPGVFTLDVSLEDPQPVNGVIIYLEQSIGGNWNEIDAVELVGFDPEMATDEPAEASPSALENTELTEVFIYDDTFSMDIPSGWVTDTSTNTPYLASDQATLDLVVSGAFDAPAEGQIGISVLFPEVATQVGLPVDDGPVALLEAFNTAVESTDMVEDYFELLYPAAITVYTDAAAPEGTISIAVEYDAGVALYVVQIGGEFADFEPLILSLIDRAFITP